MYKKMHTLADMISKSHNIVDASIQTFPDAAVVAEMVMMGTISRACRHGVYSKTATTTYERTNPCRTPSYVEEMSINSTMGLCMRQPNSVRWNEVTSAILSDCISIYEFMQRYENMSVEDGKKGDSCGVMREGGAIHDHVLFDIFRCPYSFDPVPLTGSFARLYPRRNQPWHELGIFIKNSFGAITVGNVPTIIEGAKVCGELLQSFKPIRSQR